MSVCLRCFFDTEEAFYEEFYSPIETPSAKSYYALLDKMDVAMEDNFVPRPALPREPGVPSMIADDDVEAVKHFVKAHPSLDALDDHGWALVHYAVYYGSLNVLRLLFNRGADFTTETRCGRNILHCLAVRNLHRHPDMSMPSICAADFTKNIAELTQMFSSHGLDYNKKDCNGWSPLGMALFNLDILAAMIIAEGGGAAGDDISHPLLRGISVQYERYLIQLDQLFLRAGSIYACISHAARSESRPTYPSTAGVPQDHGEIASRSAELLALLGSDIENSQPTIHCLKTILRSNLSVSHELFRAAIDADSVKAVKLLLDDVGITTPDEDIGFYLAASGIYRARSERMALLLLEDDEGVLEGLRDHSLKGTMVAIVKNRNTTVLDALLRDDLGIFEASQELTFGRREFALLQPHSLWWREMEVLKEMSSMGSTPWVSAALTSTHLHWRSLSLLGLVFRYWGDEGLRWADRLMELPIVSSEGSQYIFPETLAAVSYYVDMDDNEGRSSYPMLDWLENRRKAREANVLASTPASRPYFLQYPVNAPLSLILGMGRPSVLYELLRRGGSVSRLLEYRHLMPIFDAVDLENRYWTSPSTPPFLAIGDSEETRPEDEERQQQVMASDNRRVMLNLLVMAFFAKAGELTNQMVDDLLVYQQGSVYDANLFKTKEKELFAELTKSLEPAKRPPSLKSLARAAVRGVVPDVESVSKLPLPSSIKAYLSFDKRFFPYAEDQEFSALRI